MMTAASAVAAVKGMLQPTHPVQAKWERIPAPSLPRSSHTLSVIAGRAYIFGGEISPREPVDNDMHIITLSSGDYQKVAAAGDIPEKRVGHAAAVIGERIFMFGGRGGKEMKPLQENGRVWIYDTRTDRWSFLDPVQGTPFPAARSYHASVGIEKPEPANAHPVAVNNGTEEPAIGTIAEGAKTDAGQGGHGTFFVHAGCPESGRTGDLWGFDVHSRTWKEFPAGPGSPRGGTSIAVSKSRIYRYGGFNGTGEEGGKVDILELALTTFNDKSGSSEAAVTAKGEWQTLDFEEEGMLHPGHRSVAGLHCITTGIGREYLVLLLGERDPSSQGHDGAGKFWDDVWVFQCPPLGMTGASFKDAAWQALGKETGEGLWSQVNVSDAEGVEGEDIHKLVPGERGWFASSSLGDLDVSALVLWGGLNGKNEREDNGWILRVE
ncbi:Kelch-containing protein [Coleophoma crateriformis]|uniref:Kelch-containing protein n=1 Tax=Coleophoma crateriformis TaxID=565419 RepID=A0A3D8SXM8_9HELO|nr:Kelch-containing protein [Coleophoma crateriformis]